MPSLIEKAFSTLGFSALSILSNQEPRTTFHRELLPLFKFVILKVSLQLAFIKCINLSLYDKEEDCFPQGSVAPGFLYITVPVKVAPHPASPPPGATRNQDQSSLQLLTCHCLWGLFPAKSPPFAESTGRVAQATSQAVVGSALPNLRFSSLLGSGNTYAFSGFGGSSAPWRCGAVSLLLRS